MALIKAFAGKAPVVSPRAAFVAENATLVGEIHIEAGASIWYGAVLRADAGAITVGEDSNIQDNAVLHAGDGCSVTIGRGCTVGHCAVVHGCTLGEGALIGMHATVMNNAVVGAGSIVGAGALVTEGTVIPPHCLAVGVPARVRGPVTPALAAMLEEDISFYCSAAAAHAEEEAR